MRMLVLHEKHETRYVQAGTTQRELDRAAEHVVQERILDGYWYTEPGEEDAAVEAIRKGVAYDFLKQRSNYEYERVSLEDVEHVDYA